MKKSKLTIAIPTYNRPQQIVSQVHALIPQLNDEVELVVIDNHSDHPVESLLSDIDKAKITIVRNKYNIGADANIAKCFLLCDTEWLWVLSDDDLLSDTSVKVVFSTIAEENGSWYINFNHSNPKRSNNLNDFIANSNNCYPDLFWMSVCVYHVSFLRPYMQQYFSALSTMQPGIYLLLYAFCYDSSCCTLFSNKTIIIDGGKEISWNRERFIICSLFLMRLIDNQLPKVTADFYLCITRMCYSSIVMQFDNNRRFFHSISVARQVLKASAPLVQFGPGHLAFLKCILRLIRHSYIHS